jgi:3',5'-cyclic AMP phosphodiesterase CpdA
MRRLAHLSDLHFGTEVPALLDALGASLDAFAPDLVVVTGDLTQRARESEFARARSFLSRLCRAYLVVPGNHDIAPVYRPMERLFAPYARYRRAMNRELDGTWHDDELLVLALSSVQPLRWQEGTITRRQLDWISAEVALHPGRLRVLAAHHPLVQASSKRPTRRLSRHDPLYSALEAADVSVCLSGHLHQSFSGLAVDTLDEPGSVLAIHASTATSARRRGEANGYNQIRIEGARLQVNVTGWDGASFATLSEASYERENRVWRGLPRGYGGGAF